MTKTYIAVIATIIISGTVYAQTETEIKAQLDTVNEQLMALRHANIRSPQAKAMQAEIREASENYQQAVEALPGMKKLDNDLKALRRQMMELQKQKMQLIEANKASLQAAKQRRDAASESLRETMMGGEQGKALITEQRRLMKELAEIRNAKVEKSELTAK